MIDMISNVLIYGIPGAIAVCLVTWIVRKVKEQRY